MQPLTGMNRAGPVVLVSKCIEYTFPFGYAYLAGYLRQNGEDVRVLFRPTAGNFAPVVREIMQLDPLLVGFGTLYPELDAVAEVIRLLREAGSRAVTVVGGQMVSPIPEFAVRLTGADVGVIGEGEIPLLRLARALREGGDLAAIGGLALRDGDRVVLTGPGEFIEDLAQLPPVPFDLFPEEKWLPVGRYYAARPQPHWHYDDRVIPVHGGRGCPFHCNFCYHHSKARYRPMDAMLDETQAAVRRYRGTMLYFGDDLVIANPKRARDLVEGLGRFAAPLDYSISARFDVLSRIDDALLKDVQRIEAVQAFLHRGRLSCDYRIGSRLPARLRGPLNRYLLDPPYDFVQRRLDRWRLRLLGLRPGPARTDQGKKAGT